MFTLGWEIGDPAYHITLDHPSIRPLHARMTFEKGHWMIESMSPIDPVTVNGRPVRRDDGPQLLVDGDEVQLGQVVFRFSMP